MSRPRIKVKHGEESLVSHSGLILIGDLLEATNLKERLPQINIRCDQRKYSHADIAFSMMGLISIGKPDYDAVECFRDNPQFFNDSLGLSGCPSSATLRQRLEMMAQRPAYELLKQESALLVHRKAPAITPLSTSAGQLVPLDIDVSPLDNSKTHKEGVSRTYKGCEGYAPIFAYLGGEGWLVNSGNDSQDNFPGDEFENVEFIIKRNLRKEKLSAWLELAKACGQERSCRPGKRNWIGKTDIGIDGRKLPHPIVFEVTERTIVKGQLLALPQIEVDTYWVSLKELEAQEVIDLYHAHGTSEQFHSEIKTDLDLERLPSGSFATNELILHLGMLVYNMMRIIGQESLAAADASDALPQPRQREVQRRRVRTVMQDFIYMAGRLIRTARQWFISFGRLNPFAHLWQRIELRLRMEPETG